MEYRTLGSTGLRVSAIGMGCWAIGGDAWGPVGDDDAIAAIERALEVGVTVFDTADVYGQGHSEDLLARGLGRHRDDVVVCTKVGLWRSGADRPNSYTDPAMVIESCDASLARLRTEVIDVYQCHLWWNENTDVFLEAFEELKAQGKIRYYGVSTNEIDHLLHFDRDGTCSTLQVDYSLLNRQPEKDLLPYCADRGIGTLIKGPLKMGILTGKFSVESSFPEGDIRHGWPGEAWFDDALKTVNKLSPIADGRSMGQAALQFVLGHPAVSVAIPGAKTPEQVDENARAAEGGLSPGDRTLIDQVAPATG